MTYLLLHPILLFLKHATEHPFDYFQRESVHFFPNRPTLLLPAALLATWLYLLHPPVLWVYWTESCPAGSTKEAIGNDFFFFFFKWTHTYLSVVLWTIALWSSNLGCVFSTCLSSSDRRLGTIGLFCLGWVSLQLSRNFSGFPWVWFTCIDWNIEYLLNICSEIFAP